jgi:ATP-grasp domain-containing protein
VIEVGPEEDPVALLDGKMPENFDRLCNKIQTEAHRLGLPAFLRTGHGSGKHHWTKTCFMEHTSGLPQRIRELVEWSHVVNPLGLPTNVWAVREMIPTYPLFSMAAWEGFPVTREFRFFVFDGEIVHVQPYWPPAAIEEPLLNGQPTPENWREKLGRASHLEEREFEELVELARRASVAVPGYWSVDFLQARDREWWLTDMAFGEESFRWDCESVYPPEMRV